MLFAALITVYFQSRYAMNSMPFVAAVVISYIFKDRIKDWLKLLGFELNGGRFGCYAPPFRRAEWLARFRFMEKAGERWWPILGGVLAVVLVLGAGPGGYSAAFRAADLGLQTVIVERLASDVVLTQVQATG